MICVCTWGLNCICGPNDDGRLDNSRGHSSWKPFYQNNLYNNNIVMTRTATHSITPSPNFLLQMSPLPFQLLFQVSYDAPSQVAAFDHSYNINVATSALK